MGSRHGRMFEVLICRWDKITSKQSNMMAVKYSC